MELAFSEMVEEALQRKHLPRIERLLKAFREADRHYLDSDRAVWVTQAYQETEGEPIEIRRAKAFEKILAGIKVYILPDELIVGHLASRPRSCQVYPDLSRICFEELEDFEKRPIDPFVVTEAVKKDLQAIEPYWKGRTLRDHVDRRIPQATREQIEARHPAVFGWCAYNNGIGHICLDFAGLIQKGYRAVKGEAEDQLRKLDWTEPGNLGKEAFLRSVIRVCEATAAFTKRYAGEARRLVESEGNPVRKKDLERIAEVCTRVPEQGARTFWEAIQFLWFMMLLGYLETNGTSISPGRFDQYMYPYYEQDVKEGRLTKEEALELIECFWIKLSEVVLLYDRQTAEFITNWVMGEHVNLGGQLADGRDATNELTFLCLQAQLDVGLMQPNMSVRWHRNSPERFRLESCRVLRERNAIPQFLNDEVFVPSLLSRGIPLPKARGYASVGCDESSVPGEVAGLLVTPINVAKVLELALNEGRCRICGESMGVPTGDPRKFTSMEDVMRAFREQLHFYAHHMAVVNATEAFVHAEVMPTPFISASVKGCVERGKDAAAGGQEYYYSTCFPSGAVIAGDSLAAIDRLVFRDKRLTMEELLEALNRNFAGRESIHQMLIHKAPKYGNDDDEADRWVLETMKIFAEEVQKFKDVRGGNLDSSYWLTSAMVTAHIPFGTAVGATPDGRMAGTPLNDSISPGQGRDMSGPTAAMRSIAKIDHLPYTAGVIYNMKFSPAALGGEENLRRFVGLIKAFFELGGAQVQFNITSSETLQAAQQEPEKYKDLMVRVVGYAAHFVDLSRPVQEDLIRRTQYEEVG
jgi:pyruvate formate-lyase/glycerol dehydratase family glycyl radical enzyme